jgi:hypothetical protein
MTEMVIYSTMLTGSNDQYFTGRAKPLCSMGDMMGFWYILWLRIFRRKLKMKTNEQVEIELQEELDAMNDKISRLSEFLGENSGKTAWDFNGSESKQISFCPMCGRRLEEE